MNRWAAPTARALLAAILVSSCGGTEPPPPPRPTQLVFVTEPSAVAETMLPLVTQPVVQATDENGQAAPTSTTVTVDVVDGNGSVGAGGAVATDATGRAAFSDLRLGAVDGRVGPVTLRFSGPGLEPVTAAVDLRCAVLPLTIGQTVNRALTTGDCAFSSSAAFHNTFEVTTSQPVTAVRLTQDATFGPWLVVRGPNEPVYWWGWNEHSSSRVSFKALLPPGRNHVAVSSADPGRTGSYSLTVAATSEDLACENVVAASPITTTQYLGGPGGGCSCGSLYEDRLVVGLPPNASIAASMSSGAFQPLIKLANAWTNAVVASATAQGTASITFTNGDAPIAYYLVLTTDASGGTGPYTLSVNITYPPPGSTAAASAGAASRLPESDAQIVGRACGGPAAVAGPPSATWSRQRTRQSDQMLAQP